MTDKPKLDRSFLEKATGMGFGACMGILIILVGSLIALTAYSAIPSSPYREIITSIVVVVFLLLLLLLLRFYSIESRVTSGLKALEKEGKYSSADSPTAYLLQKVTLSYIEFARSTKWMFNAVRFYKYATVFLSATSTIILGLNFSVFAANATQELLYSQSSQNIALVLNAIVTALATLSLFWNIDKYWVQNKIVKQQLKLLRDEIEFRVSETKQLPQELLQLYFVDVARLHDEAGKAANRPADQAHHFGVEEQ